MVTIRIQPAHSAAIRLSFTPGGECPFGARTACVSRHQDGRLILLTIHSGVGGEGEGFRNAVEGTGLDAAGLSIEPIRANLIALRGSAVRIQAGDEAWGDLELAKVVRVHPMDLQRYFELPYDDALAMLADEDASLHMLLASGEPLLAFEICGWHVAGEIWVPGFDGTTASIYLGIIRLRP